MNNETIAVIANLALTLSFIVALIFGVVQVKVAARDRKERLTLETLRNFQTHEFATLLFKVNQAKIPSTFEDWRKLPDEQQIMFLQFTQSMESLGLLVAEHYVKLDLVDKTLGAFVITSWEKFEVVIADIRKKLPDPYLSEYYQWLAERLDEQMQKNPRKPFFEKV